MTHRLSAGGITVERSGRANDPFGATGAFEDVTVSPGAIVVDDAPNENQVVIRFANSLPDDSYQITISGLTTLPDETGAVEQFNNGLSTTVPFRLSLGPNVVSVVPQPISRPGLAGNPEDLSLSQSANEIVVYFDGSEPMDQASVINLSNYQLIEIDEATAVEQGAVSPIDATYTPATNSVALQFLSIDDNKTFRLEIGSELVDDVLEHTTFLAATDTDTIELVDVTDIIDGMRVYGSNIPKGAVVVGAPVGNVITISKIIPEGTTIEAGETLQFRPGVNPIDEAGGGAGTSFDTSQGFGALGALAVLPAEGVLIDGEISTNPTITSTAPIVAGENEELNFPGNPGAINESGHRDIPVNLGGERHGQTLPVGPAVEIPTRFYNFRTVYGTDPQGQPLANQITETQKQRTREIFEIFSRYLGVQFVESADLTTDPAETMTIATGDLRAFDTTLPTTPAGLAGQTTAGNVAIMDSTENWGLSEYGGFWFRTAMQQIGELLGLHHSFDLPSIMGGGLNGEAIFPGDYDLVEARQLFPNAGSDIDLYTFTLSGDGSFTAETIVNRPGDPVTSKLDTVLTLYREDQVTKERSIISRNDDSFGSDSRIELDLVAKKSAGTGRVLSDVTNTNIIQLEDVTGLFEGMYVSGSNVPANSVIVGSPDAVNNTITISQAIPNTSTVTEDTVLTFQADYIYYVAVTAAGNESVQSRD